MEKKMETAIDTTRGFRAIVKDISAWKRNITKGNLFCGGYERKATPNSAQLLAGCRIDDMCLCF